MDRQQKNTPQEVLPSRLLVNTTESPSGEYLGLKLPKAGAVWVSSVGVPVPFMLTTARSNSSPTGVMNRSLVPSGDQVAWRPPAVFGTNAGVPVPSAFMT